MYGPRGFSLLEIVIVLTVIAALAGSVIVSLGESESRVEQGLNTTRIQELREALLRFRKDMGYLPGEGLLAFDAANGVDPSAPSPVFADDAQWQAWLSAPANVLMLVEAPDDPASTSYRWSLVGAAAQLRVWDPARQRGWNGPYLRADAVEWVLVGSALAPDGSGDPTAGVLLPPMPAVADSHLQAPAASGQPFEWSASPNGRPLTHPHGRPIYLFTYTPGPTAFDVSVARLVSSGPDGRYEPWTLAPGDFSRPPAATDDVGAFVVR